MASSLIGLPKGVWTQITTTDKEGSVFQKLGSTKVVYLEAEEAPITFDTLTPVMAATTKGEQLSYYGVAAAEFIFAYAIFGDAEVTVSPKGA